MVTGRNWVRMSKGIKHSLDGFNSDVEWISKTSEPGSWPVWLGTVDRVYSKEFPVPCPCICKDGVKGHEYKPGHNPFCSADVFVRNVIPVYNNSDSQNR